ncbi:hypothetical protein HY484_04800, partial [Candidatus Woesearchaeota archaeon]|nr:hypothetical protein [Candidatus Woesearchaeota archaeon]
MGALEEKDADDAFLSQELSDSVKSMALAGKSLFMELQEKRRTKPKKNNPSEEELKVFCERTQAVARAAGYPSPETIISLKELVEA